MWCHVGVGVKDVCELEKMMVNMIKIRLGVCMGFDGICVENGI